MSARPRLSVVVPVLNEEENVVPLVEAARAALEGHVTWELIFVDDRSEDHTVREVLVCSAADSRIRLVPLARQVGQSAAMQAGFDHARGEVIVSMDGDMQNDPADIPALLAEIEQGFDLVAGYREKRRDFFVTRKLPSWIANHLIAWSTGVPIRDNGCSLKAYRRQLLDRMRLYSEMHRFIPALAAGITGARIKEIPVRHHARVRGESKYGLSRIGRVLVDLVTVTAIRSVRRNSLMMFGSLGVLSAALGLLFVALALRPFGEVGGDEGLHLVSASVGMVFLSLSLFLVMLGLVAQVAVGMDARRHRDRGAFLHEVIHR